MTPEELKLRLEKLAPGTVVEVMDYTGTSDHFDAKIVSNTFSGKTRIDRHRMVMDLVQDEMKCGEIHALTLKTWTPEEVNKQTKGAS